MKTIINFTSSILLMVCAFIILPIITFAQAEDQTTPNGSGAANEMVVLSTTNIQDATINSQVENRFNISFNFSNKEIMQNGVKYSVRLIKETPEGQIIVDEFIYPEEITLLENSVTSKIINYSASEYLSGSYKMYIVAANKNGFPVGGAFVSDVELKATKTGVVVDPETCHLSTDGKKSKDKSSFIAINKEDSLWLSCVARNGSDQSLMAKPNFTTYKHSIFGDAMTSEGFDTTTITFNPNEEKEILVQVPKMPEVQNYILGMTLSSDEGVVSNTIVKNYTVKGFKVAIDNVWVDKDMYKTGEIANLSLMWWVMNDGIESVPNVVFDASLINVDGSFCGDTVSYSLPPEHDAVKFEVPISITQDCVNPTLLAVLKDDSGNIFDQMSYVVGKRTEVSVETNQEQEVAPVVKHNNTVYLIVLIVVMSILLFVLLRYLRKDNFVADSGNSTKTFLFVFLFVAMGGIIPTSANAFTFCANQDPSTGGYLRWCNTIKVNLDKSSYPASGPMTASISVGEGVAFSLEGDYTVDGGFEKLSSPYTGKINSWGPPPFTNYFSTYFVYPNTKYGSKNLTAPSVAGDYILGLKAKACQKPVGGCYNSYWTFSYGYPHIYFNVVSATLAPTTADISLNKSSVLTTEDFTASWSGNNSPTYYKVKVNSTEYNMGSAINWTGKPTDLSLGVGPHLFYAQACNSAGCSPWSTSKTLNVSAVAPSAPTLTFTASPTTVSSGGASTLTWSTTNATACTASGAWSGSKSISGSQSTGALFSTQTYTLTCTGAGGSVNRSVTVNVSAVAPSAPTLSFTASPSSVSVGGLSMLNWSATNVTTCIASGDWSGSKLLSGSQSTGALTTARIYTYTLRCIAGGGDITRSVTVNVSSLPPPPLLPPPPPLLPPPPPVSCSGVQESDRIVTVTGGNSGMVWGSGPYTTDSNHGAVAVHAGILRVGETGQMKISDAGCKSSFTGSTRNGITSFSWSSSPWYGMNVSAVALPPPPPPPPPPVIDISTLPSVVRVGETADVKIEVTTSAPTTCTYYGIKSITGTLSHSGSPSYRTWNLTTEELKNTQIIKVECVVDGTSVSSEKTSRINVIPNFEET